MLISVADRFGIVGVVVVLIVILICMTVHEFAHNYVGYKMGDPNPRNLGKLTLNPMAHINWFGFLMFAVVGFGILGSAPISAYRMPAQNRRWRWFAAVAAGPFSNLLLAVVAAIIYNILPDSVLGTGSIFLFLRLMVSFNLVLFVLNILPLSPLDGWDIAYALLPPDLARWWERNRQTTMYIFFGLILLGFFAGRSPGIPDILGLLIGEPVSFLQNLLIGF